MNIQNIVYNFSYDLISSLFENKILFDNKIYYIPSITNQAVLKAEMEVQFGFSVDFAVVQYTVDQYGETAQPRVIFSNDDERSAFDLADLNSNLTSELNDARVEVEAEIANQIG
jgi:hypothetical protein